MSTTYKIHPAIGVARLGTAQPDPKGQKNYYLAPTEEGVLPKDPKSGEPISNFRAPDGSLLKQAAQFQVWAYEEGRTEGKPVALGSGGIKAVEWTAYLANKKAAWYEFQQLTGSGMQPDPNGPTDKGYLENGTTKNPLRNNQVTDPAERQKLILDPGPRTVGGNQAALASFDLPLDGPTTNALSFKPNVINHLGSIYAEDKGTLLVFAGDGNSGTTHLPDGEYEITNYANNEGWFDDVADGPVHATLIMEDDSRVEVDVSAWCLATPPKYAPQVVNMVDLFDTIFDVAVREQNYRPGLFKDGTFNPDYIVDFNREILPILRRPDRYKWTVNMENKATDDSDHNAEKGHKQILLEWDGGWAFPTQFLRKPEDVNGVGALNLMPRLAGDAPFTASDPASKYLTLTRTQTFLLNQWFKDDPLFTVEEDPKRKVTAGEALDHGVLRNCVGGAFCPGIEITWISRNPSIYSEPFRIKAKSEVSQGKLNALNGNDNLYKDGVEPGDLSKYMAQPWQADFNECSTQGNVSGLPKNDTQDWWWPAQRPYNVIPDENEPTVYADWTRGFEQDVKGDPKSYGDMQMVIDWQHLGFLKEKKTGIFEVERQPEKFINAVTPA